MCCLYGDIPQKANDYSARICCFRAARLSMAISAMCMKSICRNPDEIQEFVTHSWYKYPDENKGLHPWDGVTEPTITPKGLTSKGTRTRIEQVDESAKYSWVKAPALERPRHGSRLPVAYRCWAMCNPSSSRSSKKLSTAFCTNWICPSPPCSPLWGALPHAVFETLYCAKLQPRQFGQADGKSQSWRYRNRQRG